MVSTHVRQSEGSGFKSRPGEIADLHGVKTRISTLGTVDVPRGAVEHVSDKIWGTTKDDWRGWNRHCQC